MENTESTQKKISQDNCFLFINAYECLYVYVCVRVFIYVQRKLLICTQCPWESITSTFLPLGLLLCLFCLYKEANRWCEQELFPPAYPRNSLILSPGPSTFLLPTPTPTLSKLHHCPHSCQRHQTLCLIKSSDHLVGNLGSSTHFPKMILISYY